MTSLSEIRPIRKVRHLSISPVPVKDLAPSHAEWRRALTTNAPCAHGAEICFEGVVRGAEEGRAISGIEYTCYKQMVMSELEALSENGQKTFGNHPLFIHHVTGFVAEGDASIVIRVHLPHSKEAFSACQWYLAEIKEHVPIWKRAIFP